MAEVLVTLETTVSGPNGSTWMPRVCGGVGADGLWEGWIEFTSVDDAGTVVRTPRETQQPNRDDLSYWAQGLTQAYLDEALRRALEPAPQRRVEPVREASRFDGPAPRVVRAPEPVPAAALNPFDVYAQGEGVLRQQLDALSLTRLHDIVVAYRLPVAADVHTAARDDLVAAIMAAVRAPRVINRSALEQRPR